MGSTHEGHLRGVPMVIYGEYPWGSSMGSTPWELFYGEVPMVVIFGDYPLRSFMGSTHGIVFQEEI